MIKSVHTYFRFLLLFAFSTLLIHCAQVVTPGGGPKDIKAPRVERFIPDSAAINFTSKQITIVFDEYIQLVDLQKELTVSPPMKYQPIVKVKGKILNIELKDTLKKNTTYVINFGGAIRDFTESNSKKDFRYIFSTGSYIDTLKLTGRVSNAKDLKVEKGILVFLYENLGDSVPCKEGPSYFAKTNEDGSYKISNLRPGKYKAFALKDVNANSLFDSPEEYIGFSDTIINIVKDTKLDFKLFLEEPKAQKLVKSYPRGYGSYVLIYAKPVSKISYQSLHKATQTETFLTEFNMGRDTIRIWFPEFPSDSLRFQVIADAKQIDTVFINTRQFKKDNGGRVEAFKLVAKLNVSKDKPLDIHKSLSITFNYPIKKANTNDVFLMQNESKVKFERYATDSVGRTYDINFLLEQDSLYKLEILPGTFTDIFGLTNDTIATTFKLQEEKQYGSLKMLVKLSSEDKNCVLQLINEKGGVVADTGISKSANIFYSFLKPGKYKLKLIYDTNADGNWTTGNYMKHIQPENLIFFPKEINIRANWDSELDWDLVPKPVVIEDKQEDLKKEK